MLSKGEVKLRFFFISITFLMSTDTELRVCFWWSTGPVFRTNKIQKTNISDVFKIVSREDTNIEVMISCNILS